MVEQRLVSQHIRLLLWAEFERAGLIVDSARYRSCLATIAELGRNEYSDFQSLVEPSIWQKADSCLERPFSTNDFVRILGFGRLLTEFAVIPVVEGLKTTDVEKLSKLGALSNLIVTVYDHFIDLMPSEISILPRQALENLDMAAFKYDYEPTENHGAAQMYVVTQLVTTYFERMAGLGNAAGHASLWDFINRIILRMYDAEMATTRSGTQYPSEQTLRRKSSLPFVVMGLPIWLAMTKVRIPVFMQHLRWLYELGDFIGWLDDAIDLDADRQSGHPNRIQNALAQVSDPTVKLDHLVQNLGRRGKRIKYWWDTRVSGRDAAPSPCSDAFSAVIVSWFGGLAPPAQANE